MDQSTENLIQGLVLGMQDLKAKNIVKVDMTKLEAPCSHFIICEGDSSVQVNAIARRTIDFVRENLHMKPFVTDGWNNAQWVVLDYGEVICHIFYGETREFYDIEHLWEDADIQEIPNID